MEVRFIDDDCFGGSFFLVIYGDGKREEITASTLSKEKREEFFLLSQRSKLEKKP